MYRVSPVTYLVNTMASVGLAGASIACSAKEIVVISPPQGQTCGAFLSTQLLASGGSLLNPNGTTRCEICPIATTDELLATFQVFYSQRWRNFGISLVFSFVNVVGAMFLYRACQVKKTNRGPGRKGNPAKEL
jgi:ATP-binding cassette subfamily G (WHITE) protein 2 (PDR)